MHHQDPAMPAARGLQQPVKHLAFALAAEQLAAGQPNR
jgi:hypothetical protein